MKRSIIIEVLYDDEVDEAKVAKEIVDALEDHVGDGIILGAYWEDYDESYCMVEEDE